MAEIFVISGFSGAGKSSLCEEALKKIEGVELIKSYTTRPSRKQGENYTFVSLDTFIQMEIDGEFLETNTYNRNRYGTPKREVERLLQQDKNVVLEIDVQGYKNILSSELCSRTNLHGVFIVASAQELFDRLKDRNTEDMNKILERMETAIAEAKEIGFYDVIIENNDFETASKELEKFLSGCKLEKQLFNAERFVKEAEGIIQQHCMLQESPIKSDDYESVREYVNENIKYLSCHKNRVVEKKENVKMAELILQTYKIGDVLSHNEYSVLAEYFAKQKNYRTGLAILGAAFTNSLQSMSNYGTSFSICGLLQISEMLAKTKHLYNANKILEIASDWAEEEELTDSEMYAEMETSIKLLRYRIKEMLDRF